MSDSPDLAPDAAAAPRQPRKRFVGKKTADSLRAATANANGTPAAAAAAPIEDASSAILGVRRPPRAARDPR